MCHTSRGARGPPGLGRPPSGPSDLWDTLHLCDHFSLQLSNSGRLAELASETLVVRATRLPPEARTWRGGAGTALLRPDTACAASVGTWPAGLAREA